MSAVLDLPDQMPRAVADKESVDARTPPEVLREIRLAAALFLYEHRRVSAGRATELAGVSRAEFITACGANGILSVDYDPRQLDDELRVLGLEPEPCNV